MEKDFPHVDPRVWSTLKGKVPAVPPGLKRLWRKEGLAITTHEVVSEPDGNAVEVVMFRPEGAGPLPCVMYLHGGGMAVGSIHSPPWNIVGRTMAHQGVCAAMVEFRNSLVPSQKGKATGKYPAGLNDCVSALKWLNANKEALGIGDRVVVAGESGGGNLTLAVALRLKREGRLSLAQGFYALCPYIAGKWPQRPGGPGEILGTSHLDPEHGGNDGLVISAKASKPMAGAYGKEALEAKDPLAWPGFASEEDVRGLPPCVISVDEFDPLRDEGINFYRLLLRAGVRVRCVVLSGVVHGGELMIPSLPDVALPVWRSVADFAAGLGYEAGTSRL